jgi:chromosome segregation ATPase
MENGSFQKLNLTEIDFAEIEERSYTTHTPAPVSHQILDFTEIPRDVRKSGTVEALISQNEDLMARLKVNLRRMTALEDETRSQQENLTELKRSYAALSDQMLVWKEKEKIWKDRNENLEKELKVFQDRFPEYQKMETQLDRLKRYQERVKTTIKPYLQQLKDYAQSLHVQIQSMNKELNLRDAMISSLEHRIEDLKTEKAQQIQFYEMNQNQLVDSFEKEKSQLQGEIQSLLESNQALELRTQNLDRSLERQDELENLVISLRRNKESLQAEIQNEMDTLKIHNRELKQKLVENGLSNEDLLQERDSLKKELSSLAARCDEMEEQMTSLRYMWTTKSEENEKLKVSMTSLEKLNLELSSKLNELRKQS